MTRPLRAEVVKLRRPFGVAGNHDPSVRLLSAFQHALRLQLIPSSEQGFGNRRVCLVEVLHGRLHAKELQRHREGVAGVGQDAGEPCGVDVC